MRPLISSVPGFDDETTTPPQIESAFSPPRPAAADDSAADLDATQLSTRRRTPQWKLILPDGRKLVVDKTTLLGRKPASSPRWPGARLEAVADSAKSVSKTHAVLEVDADGLWITDLGSTNGVLLTQPDGTELDLGAEERTRVLSGADIDLGDFAIRAESE